MWYKVHRVAECNLGSSYVWFALAWCSLVRCGLVMLRGGGVRPGGVRLSVDSTTFLLVDLQSTAKI